MSQSDLWSFVSLPSLLPDSRDGLFIPFESGSDADAALPPPDGKALSRHPSNCGVVCDPAGAVSVTELGLVKEGRAEGLGLFRRSFFHLCMFRILLALWRIPSKLDLVYETNDLFAVFAL